MPASQASGHGGYLPTIADQIEGMQDQPQPGEVGPNVIYLGELENAVERQPRENVGDLVRQHCRTM